MDKLMDNPWFIKIIALVLAFLLYSSVSHTGADKDVNVPGDQTSATITNIPVKVYYDTDNLVVSGIPDTVEVTIKGPVTHVQPAKVLKNFEVYVDLTKAKVGNQKVKLHIKNLSDKLNATIDPAYANVSVQEKITKEFKVSAEYNNSLIEDGYTAGQAVVEPNKVRITGAKDVVDRITYVKATVDLKQSINATVTKEAQILVLDRELNKLNVNVDPETVKVTVPIKDTSKTVPIDVIQKGTPPDGVIIDSIELDSNDATILGQEEIIKVTDHVRAEIDVSNISENTTVTVPVIISDGITKVSPQVVTATIKVKKANQKTLSNVPIKTKGLSDQYRAEILDPVNGSVNLLVNGTSDSINKVGTGDFNLYIDVSNLTEGEHNVKIEIEGPSGVDWKPDKSTAKISITKI